MKMQKRERHPRDAILSELRIGMSVAKGHAPTWIKSKIPDAPSVAIRFSPSPTAEGISLAAPSDDELDILFTAGGDRLWKLLWNLALGGRFSRLNQFDYSATAISPMSCIAFRIAVSMCGFD
jgi:hypothetical protein